MRARTTTGLPARLELMTCPVMKLASSLTRNRASRAMSSGSAPSPERRLAEDTFLPGVAGAVSSGGADPAGGDAVDPHGGGERHGE